MLADIIEEHFDEAVFSYEMGQAVDESPSLRVHLDALLLGGEKAWAICEPRVREGEHGAIFVGAVIGVKCGGITRASLERLAVSAPEATRHAIHDALAVLNRLSAPPNL